MSEPRCQPAPASPDEDRFAERARALIALLGRDGVQSIAERRLPEHLARRLMRAVDASEDRPDAPAPPGPREAEAAPRRHDFSGEASEGETLGASGSKASAAGTLRPLDRQAIRRLVALNARPGDLEQEHPAVLALLLADQSPALKTATLRALPGATARRVLRLLDRGAEA